MKKLFSKFFSNPTPSKRIVLGIFIGLFFASIIVFLYMIDALISIESLFADLRTVTGYFSGNKNSTDIVYLNIDDNSLNQLEINDGLAYPWPRDVWAEVLKFLYASEVKSVVFDISFFQARDEIPDKAFADTLARFNDTVLATAFTRKTAENQFAKDIEDAQLYFSEGWYNDSFIKLAQAYYNTEKTEEKTIAEKTFNHFLEQLKKIDADKGIKRDYKDFNDRLNFVRNSKEQLTKKLFKYRIVNFETDNSVIIDNALNAEIPVKILIGEPFSIGPTDSIGDVKLTTDKDGVARRVVSVVEFDGNYYPSLALAGVLEALKFDISEIEIKIKNNKLYIGNKEKARIDFPKYRYELKTQAEKVKDIFSNELNEAINNIVKMLENVDEKKDVPFGNIEKLLKDIEREFTKLKMLERLMNAFSEFKENKKDSAKNFELFITEAEKMVNIFSTNEYNQVTNLKKILRSSDSYDYKKNIEAYEDFINRIPQKIYASFSLIIQQISTSMGKMNFIEDFSQSEPNAGEININENNYKQLFIDMSNIYKLTETSIRKINEIKNARIVRLDNDGLIRLKFYGKARDLPNVAIYKVIKTWAGIKELWNERVSKDIVSMANQHIRTNAMKYAGDNPEETIVSGKLGDYYISTDIASIQTPSSSDFPREIIRVYGKETLINILTEALEKMFGKSWYYILINKKDNEKLVIFNDLIAPLKRTKEFSTLKDEEVFNFVSTVIPSLLNIIWNIPSVNIEIDRLIEKNGLENIINIIIENLKEYTPSDSNWVEYYLYKDNFSQDGENKINTIYSKVSNNIRQEISENNANISDTDLTNFLRRFVPEILMRIELWAKEYEYDLFEMMFDSGEFIPFFKEFIESCKSRSILAERLLKQKVLYKNEADKIKLKYINNDNEEITFEEAFDDRLDLISIGANVLEEYIKLVLARRGESINDENLINELVMTINEAPSPSPEELLTALYNIMGNKNTSERTINEINKILLINPSVFKDKIILVLTDAASLLDLRRTPVDSKDAGGNLHGHGMLNMLNDDYTIEYDTPIITVLIILIAGLFISIMALLLPIRRSIIIFLVTFCFYNAIAFGLHYFWTIFINMTGVSLSLFLCYLSGITINFILESKQKGFIEGAFSQFLAPEILNRLMKDPSKLSLGGETKELSIFFSDVAGFTTMSEKLTPEKLVEILNYYLTQMADIIVVNNNGYVDKYEGDAIMAFWGAPVDDEKHAIKACYAALDNQKKLKEIQDYFKEKGLGGGISIRIGINTGNVVVGMMGSQKKLNYTVIGDAVNLASRLEGANKQFGTEIMISEHTYKHVKDLVEVRELDSIRVKGKTEPTRVYELIAKKGEISETKAKIVELYNKGLELYRKRSFKEAIEYFKKALEINENDGPSKTYIGRAEEYIKNPPSDDWDGVYTMTSK